MIARVWHGTVALLVLAAMVVQIKLAVNAPGHPPGHAVGYLAGATLPGRILRVLSFFTIQSNLLVAATSGQLAVRPDRDGPVWRVLRLDGLFGIAVTGIVYSTVLARIHEPKGWEQVSTNTVFHYIVPIMAVLGWLLFGPRPRITSTVLAYALVWPVLWFGYTMIMGEITHWYPYPFVDVSSHGYGRVLLNALAVTGVLAAVAFVMGLVDKRLRPTPSISR